MHFFSARESAGPEAAKPEAECSQSATFDLGSPGGGPGSEPAYSPYGCGKNAATEIYLNLPVVRKAIHVKFVPSASNPTGKPDYEGNTYK